MPNTPFRFLDLDPAHSDPRSARYVVLPIPFEGTVTYKTGTAGGPLAILQASGQVELLDEELHAEFHQAGVATFPIIQPAAGPQEQASRVEIAARPLAADGKFVIGLGGEHGMTPPLVAAVAETHGELSVLQIDAHADLRDEYLGSKYNHACVMARVLEITPRIVQVGIRSFSDGERRAFPERVENFVAPRAIAADPGWIDRVVGRLGEKVYVTVDMDGFDPACAPGVGTPEPGGLDWWQVTGLLRRVCTERTVVAADIAETRPLGANHVTECLAARLAYKIIAYTQL